MSLKADNDADERADTERTHEGNSNESVEKPESWSHSDSSLSLLSGCVEREQRSRNAEGEGSGDCGFVTGASRQKGTGSLSHAPVGRLLWVHGSEAGTCTYQKPIPVLVNDLNTKQEQASL